jgi:ABC-2 type transport system permease protein
VAFGVFLVMLALWFPLVRYSVQHIERPFDPSNQAYLGWFSRLPIHPFAMIGARVLTYWERDRRYRVALIAIPLAPIVIVMAFQLAGFSFQSLAFVPLPVMLLLFGWSLHNDVATDSTAIWMHVASGTRGLADRFGRLFPVLMIGLPLILVGSAISVEVASSWNFFPGVLGMNFAVLAVACAVASVFSALLPYPATRPGDSPFAQPSISGGRAGTSQTLSMVAAVALSAPPVWLSWMTFLGAPFASELIALSFGIGYGVLILLIGLVLGGRIFERYGPELVALTQTFD